MNQKDEAGKTNAQREEHEMDDQELEQVSGGNSRLQFEIQTQKGEHDTTDKKPRDRGVFENITYKY